jgi:hypothetical protein
VFKVRFALMTAEQRTRSLERASAAPSQALH